MQLVRYDAACRALAEAMSVDEVRDIRDKAEAMRAYARQAKNRKLEVDAAEIRFRAERRLGELLTLAKDAGQISVGQPPKNPSDEEEFSRVRLSDAGIDHKLSSRAQKIAAVPEQQFEGMLGEWRDRVQQENERVTTNLLAEGERRLHFRAQGTGENEWYTPPEYIEAARRALGHIHLDPATSAAAQSTVRADHYFTLSDDGLTQQWFGNVWLNPPYEQPAIDHFATKMVQEVEAGNVEAAVMLTHNYTDTAWFHRLASAATAICFTRGRIKFVRFDGATGAPTQGQAFFYYGNDVEAFAREFAAIGFIVEMRR